MLSKNTDYDDSFSKSIDSMEDKMNRVKATAHYLDKAKVNDETVSDTLLDLANYSLMLLTEYEIRKVLLIQKLEQSKSLL